MRYNNLGNTGLFVSELCLGTMTFGGKGMWTSVADVDQEGATALVKSALDAGVNFIDTANVYSEGLSEQMTGRALADLGVRRSDVVVATKALGPMGEGVNDRGASRFHLLHQIDASLERLGLDHVDLYQIHGWDPETPIEQTLRALDQIVSSGRARDVGVSNWAAWQIMKALGISERLCLEKFVSVQAYYSLAGRDIEREIVPLLRSEGLGLMVWSPLAGGFLSGKYTREGEAEGRRAGFDFPPVDKDRAYEVIEVMREVAQQRGCTVAQVALGWLLARPAVSTVIVGAKRPEQLRDNLGAVDIDLPEEDIGRLDSASSPKPEYPGWMIELQSAYRQAGRAGEQSKS